MSLTMFDRGELTPEWRWRVSKTNNGGVPAEILPRDMVTRHLFFTLRMIWNHSTPEYMHVGEDIRYYTFPKFYTKSYMVQAIRHIGSELSKRTDLEPEWSRQLYQMASWFRQDDFDEILQLEAPRKALTHG